MLLLLLLIRVSVKFEMHTYLHDASGGFKGTKLVINLNCTEKKGKSRNQKKQH